MSDDYPLELASPAAVIEAWRAAEQPQWVPYAPGDGTRYYVLLIKAQQWWPRYARWDALLVRLSLGIFIVEHPAICSRVFGSSGYDVHAWIAAGHSAETWAGMRPLLAQLNWAAGPPRLTQTTDAKKAAQAAETQTARARRRAR